jgi:UDP-N-acetylglucosamine 2-epimerase (non-hydrolysing)
MTAMKLLCVAGARPNFMKFAPLLRELARFPDEFVSVLVHTGQHYDQIMSGQILRDLQIREPDHNLEVGSASHAVQTAEIMKRFEQVALQEQPAAVIVVGDVNSTLAATLVAKKLLIPVVHVEAGLRSFDRAMPEEINRVLTDAVADLLLVTEESGRTNLRAEGVSEDRIRLVGNLMVDSLYFNLETASRSDALQRLGIAADSSFGVVTLHRPANVDDACQFEEIFSALTEISKSLPLYFPVHPRTRARVESAASRERIRLLEPLGYLDFLAVMSRSSVVLTDSGGIQEETTALGIPCLTLRENTERPVTITEGTNRLAGTTRASILAAWSEHQRQSKAGRVPGLWDGHAAERSVHVLREFLAANAAAR